MSKSNTVRSVLNKADLDAEVLLSFILNKPREFLYSHPEKKLTKLQLNKFKQLLRRKNKGEPIAYITGQKEFYGLPFCVNKNALIPRPDTEVLIDEVIKSFDTILPSAKSLRILDVGTGSGCIAVTLKKYLPKSEVIATDISKKALDVARKNASGLVKFYQSDLFSKVPNKYKNKLDLIIFNPPYLTKNEAKKKNLKYEPQVALTPKDFSELMNKFFKQSQEYISKNGSIFIEIGHRQAKQVKKISSKYYPSSKTKIIKDLGGYDRVVKINLNQGT